MHWGMEFSETKYGENTLNSRFKKTWKGNTWMANLLKLKTTFDGKNIRTNGKINLGAFKDYFPKEDAEQIAGKVNGMISDFVHGLDNGKHDFGRHSGCD